MARGYRFGVVGSLSTIPDGSTVLPKDDIQIWLKCASIKDKAYTTLSQVLADSTTLQALISSNNAVDYMVRSTTWASGVTADSGAMTLIGANNYASNTLIGNSTWVNAICNSTYFESVLNAKVPKMTSNTIPSGQARCGNENSGSAYKAFDRDASTYASTASTGTNKWVEYIFDNAVRVCKVEFLASYSVAPGSIKISISHSADGTNYTDDITNVDVSNNTKKTTIITSENSFRYWRIDSALGTTKSVIANEVQFYGRVDV